MSDLPTGTVTFLFTDIEGSTRMLQALGPRYVDVLLEHRRVLREVFGRNHGIEFGTEGDAFFVAFASATDAANATIEGQRALAAGPVKVRMGLHTGEPDVASGDYVGIDVHRAARIASTAHGGQVVISERTRSFLKEPVEIHDLGLHRLKDLAAPEKLYQLGPGEFPPLRSLNATNLPTQAAPLIGRRQEIAEITDLFAERRVVTLTGPGGTGKTRLALQAAAEMIERFKDGVFWAPLATVTDPDLVLPTVAGSLTPDIPLADHIGDKRMLLVLDNLEQVLDAAPQIATLVTSCPNVHLMITSRAPLRIEGEREYAVDPLPDADAVALFRERAVADGPDDVVSEIVRRVDRLPLAIELAAARTRIFTPEQLLERIDQRLPLLTGGRRDLPERQRTLRAAIEWSYDLLPIDGRGLFERLAVFPAGFDLEAAEAVTDATIDGVELLAEESLLRRQNGRFAMLETIREFANERLIASDVSGVVRERHARHFLELAERAAPHFEGAEVGAWIRRLAADEDNFRAALSWILDTGASAEALRLCVALTDYWHMRSQIEEGIRWFERALAVAGDVDAQARASALTASGTLLSFANRREDAIDRLRDSVAVWRTTDDSSGLAEALRSLGSALGLDDPGAAERVLSEALELSIGAGDQNGERRVLHLLGEYRRDAGDYDEGARLLERSIAISSEMGAVIHVGGSTHSLADLELDRGNLRRAAALYRETLRIADDNGLHRHKVYCLGGLAAVAARSADVERASLLWRSAERAEREQQFRMLDLERARYERALEGIAASENALDLDEAVAAALESESAGS
jgi:predicted ATPase/class 3 adenylate cyclase